MSSTFITKRPHKKSRAGCKTCKTRKVKCDERHPTCTFCATRNILCIYPSYPVRSGPVHEEPPSGLITPPRSSSPSSDRDEGIYMPLKLINPMPPVLASSRSLSQTDLRLMYHWSTFTFDSIGVGGNENMNHVMRFVLPELAFENEFLLDGMLGIASLHRQRLLPYATGSQRQTDLYRFKALSSFRKAVAKASPDPPNFEAYLVMSLLVVVLCSQDYNIADNQLTVVRWFVLYRGLKAIFLLRSDRSFDKTSVFPVFKRQNTELTAARVIPTVLMNMLASVHTLDPDYAELPHYCKILDEMGMLYASLGEDGLGGNLNIRVISWPSYGTDEFAKLANENRPRALVILAHYLVFLKLVKGVWWVEGIPDRDIKAIDEIVGPKYAMYMEVPLQATQMTNLEDIRDLLLR